VTNWLRTESELDYIVEPDMFHDFFGHVPILTQPAFADFMQMYGEKAKTLIDRRRRRDDYPALLVHGRIRPDRRAGPAAARPSAPGLMSSFTELNSQHEGAGAHHVPSTSRR
jgi:phenylalanine-4-hydroxylase